VKQRQYKLFAVVYHNGREATKGEFLIDSVLQKSTATNEYEKKSK
jgi:hypothetical protein